MTNNTCKYETKYNVPSTYQRIFIKRVIVLLLDSSYHYQYTFKINLKKDKRFRLE